MVVLEDGQVAEEGSLEDLTRHGGSSLPVLLSQGAAKVDARAGRYVFCRQVDICGRMHSLEALLLTPS